MADLRPLHGLKVVDLSRNAPGPLATMLMADFGAEVTQVVRPVQPGFEHYSGGTADDPYTAMRFQRYDAAMRGKRSVALDLKTEQGREAVLRLTDRADVFVEEMRPGKAAKLGLGYKALAARNPGLIYCSISGFGQTGPLRDAPGHDLTYLALSGALSLIRDEADRPVNPQNILADNGAGSMMALVGVLLALIARARTGRGQHVDVSITDATLVLMTDLISTALGGGHDPEGWRGRYTGEAPHFRPYRCACGGWLTVAALETVFAERFFAVLGRADLAEALADRGRWPWIRAELEAAFAARPRDEWIAAFEGQEACVAPMLSLAEAAAHPQTRAREMVVETDGIRQVGIAPKLSATPGGISAPPRRLGEDTAAVLAELGLSERAAP
ncbi:MAG: CaiB/BaiF CoA-transferase family protein [Pseudomonadota bacterium]